MAFSDFVWSNILEFAMKTWEHLVCFGVIWHDRTIIDIIYIIYFYNSSSFLSRMPTTGSSWNANSDHFGFDGTSASMTWLCLKVSRFSWSYVSDPCGGPQTWAHHLNTSAVRIFWQATSRSLVSLIVMLTPVRERKLYISLMYYLIIVLTFFEWKYTDSTS